MWKKYGTDKFLLLLKSEPLLPQLMGADYQFEGVCLEKILRWRIGRRRTKERPAMGE
jgi:hypothetical protein